MAKDYVEIKVKGKAERKADKTETQETAQIEAERRASQAGAKTEKRRTNADRDTGSSKADEKGIVTDIKEKAADIKRKIL